MNDGTTRREWHLTLTMVEDDITTTARALLDLGGGRTMEASGIARRLPVDPSLPVVGEELAAARSLSQLAHQLIDHAATTLDMESAAFVE
jgi:hypothetical protein